MAAAAVAAPGPRRLQVICPPGAPQGVESAVWSPNGKLLAYVDPQTPREVAVASPGGLVDRRSTYAVNGIRTILWTGPLDVVYQDVLGGIGATDYRFGPRMIVEPSLPDRPITLTLAGLSPDGRLLLATRAVPPAYEPHVVTIDFTGKETDLGPGFRPVWSPDGTRIAFGIPTSPLTKSASLATMAADGSDRRVVVADLPELDAIAWSPDGTQLAYSRGALNVVGVDGTGGRFVAFAGDPRWRDNGLWFTTQSLPSPPSIDRFDPATGAVHVVRRDAVLADVSRDGTRLAYVVEPTSFTPGLRVADARGRDEGPVARCLGGARADEIWGSPLRDVIVAGDGNDVVHVRGGGPDRVACGPGRDTVYADRADTIARDCERVIRSR